MQACLPNDNTLIMTVDFDTEISNPNWVNDAYQ